MKNPTPKQLMSKTAFVPFIIITALSLTGMSCDTPELIPLNNGVLSNLKLMPVNESRFAVSFQRTDSNSSRHLETSIYSLDENTPKAYKLLVNGEYARNTHMAINQNGLAVSSYTNKFSMNGVKDVLYQQPSYSSDFTSNYFGQLWQKLNNNLIPDSNFTPGSGTKIEYLIGIKSASSTAEVMSLILDSDNNFYKRIFSDTSMSWNDAYSISHNNNPPRDENSVAFAFGSDDATIAWVTDENELFINIHQNNGNDNIEQAQLIKATDSRVEVLDVKQSNDANHRMVFYTVDGVLSIAYRNTSGYNWTSWPLTFGSDDVAFHDFDMAKNGTAIVSWSEIDDSIDSTVHTAAFGYISATGTFWTQSDEFEDGVEPKISINALGNALLIYRDAVTGNLISREFSAQSRTWSEPLTIASNLYGPAENTYDVYIGDNNQRMAAWIALSENTEEEETLTPTTATTEIQTYFYSDTEDEIDPPTGTAVLTLDVRGAGRVDFVDENDTEYSCENDDNPVTQRCTFNLTDGRTITLQPTAFNTDDIVTWTSCALGMDYGLEGCIIELNGNQTVEALFQGI